MNPNNTRAAREEMTKAGMGRDDIDRTGCSTDAMDGTDLGASESQLVTVILDS